MSDQTLDNYRVPLRMLQHPAIPLRARVLLAYSTFLAKGQKKAWPTTRHIAFMVGLVGENGEPTDAQYRAIRNARAALAKGTSKSPASILWEKGGEPGEPKRHQYAVIAPPLHPATLPYLNRKRTKWLYADGWGSETASEEISSHPEEEDSAELPSGSEEAQKSVDDLLAEVL